MLEKLQEQGKINYYESKCLGAAFNWKLTMFPYWWTLPKLVGKDAYEKVMKMMCDGAN